jgi:hypothetical protein
MSPANVSALRRSSRVPLQIPIHVTSLEPNAHFSEVCETMVVNAHGCALRLPIPLDAGSALQLHSKEGRETTARVVTCVPIGNGGRAWMLGARLDQPENFWGLKTYPDDWRGLEIVAPSKRNGKLVLASAVAHETQLTAAPTRAILGKVEEQLSEDRLRGILAKLVRPLQAEMNELADKLARQAHQNRFEVSLGSIPPELEEKLWQRLRQDLGARALEQTREQSSTLLNAAKADADQKITAALTEFRNRLSGEVRTVEQRAQALAKELTTSTQQQVRAGVEKLQQEALEAGAELSAQGAKLSTTMEHQLAESHRIHRQEIEQLHTTAAATASRLESQVADLNRSVSALNESVRHLEADLDRHLRRLCDEIVSGARTELGEAVGTTFRDFQTRSSNDMDARLDEVCSHLRSIQNRIEHSFAGSLQLETDEAAQAAAKQFEELAQQSAERWRLALARNLNSVAQTLGQELQKDFQAEPGDSTIVIAE